MNLIQPAPRFNSLFILKSFVLCGILATCLSTKVSAFELSPSEPSDCDPIALTVFWHFTEDCDWIAETVNVEFINGTFDIGLQFKGSDICKDIEIDVPVEVQLGRLAPGDYKVSVSLIDFTFAPQTFEFTVSDGGCFKKPGFIRGDANSDSKFDIADPITALSHTFLGEEVKCREALDADANGEIEITDSILMLSNLFLGKEPPAAPHPECGNPEQGFLLDCEVPQCTIDDNPVLTWMSKPDGCVQCVPCDTPPLPKVVEQLNDQGIPVYNHSIGALPVCLACEVCSSGIIYQIQIEEDDIPILEQEGWVVADPIIGFDF